MNYHIIYNLKNTEPECTNINYKEYHVAIGYKELMKLQFKC